MKSLGLFLALCSIAALPSASSHLVPGLCETMKLQCNETLIGSYCPQCDARGHFLPRQCWPSTGYCWCVDVQSGEEVPGTSTPPGTQPVDCGQLGTWCDSVPCSVHEASEPILTLGLRSLVLS